MQNSACTRKFQTLLATGNFQSDGNAQGRLLERVSTKHGVNTDHIRATPHFINILISMFMRIGTCVKYSLRMLQVKIGFSTSSDSINLYLSKYESNTVWFKRQIY